MAMNQLSAEMLLARFFDATLLGTYCEKKLGKSAKGSAVILAARIAREWAKPITCDGNSTSKNDSDNDDETSKRQKTSPKDKDDEAGKNSEDGETDLDWRAPLFYWKGTLTFQKQQKSRDRLVWAGSWFASSEGLPSDQDFESTKDNSFSLYYTLTKEDEDHHKSGDLSLDESWLLGRTGKFQGAYMLDNGTGHEKCKDKKHEFAVIEGGFLVAARGETDFGAFVSLGRIEQRVDDKAWVLTLARRYMDDRDARIKALPTAGDVLESLDEDVKTGMAPFWTGIPGKPS
jgi:hypothetical protein